MSSKYKSRLGLKFTAVAAIALVSAFAVFLLLYEGVTYWILYGPTFDSYWQAEETAAVASFQAYVTENELTIDEAIRDVKWEKTYKTAYLYLDRGPQADTPQVQSDVFPGVPLTCSDGVIYAYAYQSDTHYDNLALVISFVIAAVCFFLILIPYVYRIIRRITHLSQEMEILTGGNLDYHIASPGEDELAELGRGIEKMRLSVIGQMARENEAVLANSQLITSLSHDLRTPLTKLTGYLEIIHLKKFEDCAEEERFINSALEKAQQMKSLSDEMFRHFQVSPQPQAGVASETVSGALLLSQLLSELCFDLQAAGFNFDLPVIESDFDLTISIFDLRRVFDNLFSNIKKYADPAKPVVVTVSRQTWEIVVMIQNHIGQGVSADSRGIGLPTVRTLMGKNGGRMNVTTTDTRFYVSLFFPVVRQ